MSAFGPNWLQAMRENGMGHIADHVERQRAVIKRETERAEMAERQVRGLARENERLRRELRAALCGALT